MNLRFTEGLILVMLWQRHDEYIRELKKICKKYPQADDGIERIQRLLAMQFDPKSPEVVIAPGKIHRIHADVNWELWKVEVLVPKSALKPNQWPRLWFGVSGETITFLCIASHIQNYDTNEKDRHALSRMSDIL